MRIIVTAGIEEKYGANGIGKLVREFQERQKNCLDEYLFELDDKKAWAIIDDYPESKVVTFLLPEEY